LQAPAPGLEADARAAIDALRASREYAEVLEQVREIEQIASDVLGESCSLGSWTLATEVKVDYAALGIPIDEAAAKVLKGDGSLIKIYYCHSGKNLDIKLSGVMPTGSGGHLPSVAGFVAMYIETALWNTWHPLISGKGPIELWPKRPYRNLWQVPLTLFMHKLVEMVEERMHFLRDEGVFIMNLDGKEPDHEYWKLHPPPAPFKQLPGVNKAKSVITTQKHTTAFTFVMSTVGTSALPGFIVKFIVTWLLPEIVRRMLKAGGASCRAKGPHEKATQEDALGLYAECQRLAARGAELDELLGRKPYTPQEMPTPDIILGRSSSLVVCEEAFLKGDLCQVPVGKASDLASAPEGLVTDDVLASYNL